MVSFLSLITLFLRLTLAIQGQVEAVADFSFAEEKITCKTADSTQASLHVDPTWWTGNINLSRKLENEERIEAEAEVSLFHYSNFSLHLLFENRGLVSNPSFGTKAIRGSLPPLYDFFQSWKIHLS